MKVLQQGQRVTNVLQHVDHREFFKVIIRQRQGRGAAIGEIDPKVDSNVIRCVDIQPAGANVASAPYI
jgi:hypothetical protein